MDIAPIKISTNAVAQFRSTQGPTHGAHDVSSLRASEAGGSVYARSIFGNVRDRLKREAGGGYHGLRHLPLKAVLLSSKLKRFEKAGLSWQTPGPPPPKKGQEGQGEGVAWGRAQQPFLEDIVLKRKRRGRAPRLLRFKPMFPEEAPKAFTDLKLLL